MLDVRTTMDPFVKIQFIKTIIPYDSVSQIFIESLKQTISLNSTKQTCIVMLTRTRRDRDTRLSWWFPIHSSIPLSSGNAIQEALDRSLQIMSAVWRTRFLILSSLKHCPRDPLESEWVFFIKARVPLCFQHALAYNLILNWHYNRIAIVLLWSGFRTERI